MSKLKRQLKEKFGYDVSALPAWTDNTMPVLITDLIENSDFLSTMTLETDIKGTKEIALLNADVTLKAKAGCTPSPDGSVIFTKRNLTTVPLYAGIEFCNEDLNAKMTQVLNKIGLKMQDGQLPADLETILMAYLMKQLQRKAQRLVVMGDTGSIDVELALMNGLRHILANDTAVNDYLSAYTTSNFNANAYTIAFELASAIPAELFDNGEVVNIYTGRAEALAILNDWNGSNPYNVVQVPVATGTSMTFQLPLTNINVITLPELNGLKEMFAAPMSLTFLGTDSLDDMTFDIKYHDYDDKLKAECSFRLGVQIVFPEYFTRLSLAAS